MYPTQLNACRVRSYIASYIVHNDGKLSTLYKMLKEPCTDHETV